MGGFGAEFEGACLGVWEVNLGGFRVNLGGFVVQGIGGAGGLR